MAERTGGKAQRRKERKGGAKSARQRPLQPVSSAWEPPDTREALWHVLPLVVLILGVYVATAPRSVVLEDDGEFIAAVHLLGVAHPPGYPLFVLLSKPFTWLPVGEVAFRVHIATSFFAALCCGCVWWTARSLLGSAWLAWFTALAFAFSSAFWSQAVIADVYSLNAAIFFALLCLSLSYVHSPRTSRLGFIALLASLGLSNH